MHPVRIALVGCGEGAERHHLPILARTPGAVLTVLVDPDPERRAAAARHAPRATLLADHRDVAGRPDVDAVVCCLPSGLHAEAACDALVARKHVYVEKPLATSLADAARVRTAWRRAAVVGMIGFNYRCNRLYRNARRHIVAGRLGELVGVRTVFSIAEHRLPAWKRSRASGGGALNELGSHHIDLVRFLFGEITQVRADLRSRRSEADTAFVQMRLESGLVVQSLFAFGVADEERFEIHGSDGTLIVDRSRHQDVRFERPERRWRRLRRVGHALAQVVHAPYVLEKRLVPGHEPSHRIALHRFVEAAAGESRSVGPDLDDGYACVAVVDAAERSARERRAVTPDLDGCVLPDAETRRG
jgi:predicted dehydrogenase